MIKNAVRFLCSIIFTIAAGPALATFHLWVISEVYSNADSTVQFIELSTSSGGQEFLAGHSITSTTGSTTQSFTFPSDLPGDTAERRFLIGTAGFTALGLVTPDYTVPNGFLSTTNGSVNFAGVDAVSWSALPTDGVRSINHSGVIANNSPTNFAGVAASIAATPAQQKDIRAYIPAAMASVGYNGFIRVINTSATATPVTVALIDGPTGVVGPAGTLISSVPPGAAMTFSSGDIENALGTSIPASSRPRIRVGTQQIVEVQSFMSNPGGVITQISGAQNGATSNMRAFLPAALGNIGYTSFLRVINTGSNTTAIQIAIIDGNTGAVGNSAVLNAALPSGAAITYSAQQIEDALGVTLPASARPRLRVTSTTAIDVQSFMSNPGGVVTEEDAVE